MLQVKGQLIDIPLLYPFLYASLYTAKGGTRRERKRAVQRKRKRERTREFEGERNAAPWRTSRRSVYRRRPNMYDPSRRYYSPPLEIAATDDDDGVIATLPAKDRSGSMSRIRAEHQCPRTGPANVPPN